MNKRTISAVAVGIIMYALLIALAYAQRDLTLAQLVLMLATPFVIGFLSGGIKKGLMLGFLISLVMFTIEVMVIQQGILADVNVALTVIIMMVLPLVLISAGLGAVGGFAGKKLLK